MKRITAGLMALAFGSACVWSQAARANCFLQIVEGGISLTHPTPTSTRASVRFTARNTGDTACLAGETINGTPQAPGLSFDAAINALTREVSWGGWSPFNLIATTLDDNSTGALQCTSTPASPSSQATCVWNQVNPDQAITIRGTLDANTFVADPFCLQGVSFGRGGVNTFSGATADQGMDALSVCSGQPTGGGGNPLLIAVKDDLVDPVRLGDTIEYRVRLTFRDSGVFQPTFVDTLPTGTTYLGFTAPEGWNCTEDTGVVTCSAFGSVPSGTGAVIVLRARADQIGTVVNTCAASAPGGGGPPVDNSGCIEDTTILPPSADLSIDLSDSMDPVVAGGAYNYTLVASNSGPSDAVDLVATLVVPAGVSFDGAAVGGGWNCSSALPTVTCTRPALASGTTAPTITVPVLAPSSAGQINASALISSETDDPIPANNSDSELTQITGIAGLSITKNDSADPVDARSLFAYTLSVTNAGPTTATALVVTDTLPADVQFQSANGSGWSCSASGQDVTCTRATLDVGTESITINVRAPAEGGVVSNIATVSSATPDPDPADNTAVELTVIRPIVDLEVEKTGPGSNVRLGQQFDYQLSLSNAGPSTATGVSVTDLLPANVSLVSTSGAGWTCSGSTTVLCNLVSTVAAGATAPLLTIRVRAIAVGPSTNTCVATVTAGTDPNGQPLCREDVTILPPEVDLEFAKTDVTDPVAVGGTINFVISGSNLGPDTAPSVTMTDTLPAGTTWISASGSGWICSHSAGVVTCTRGATPVGAIPAISIQVTAPNDPGPIDNTCVVEAAGTVDPSPGDGDCTETTGVDPRADLALVKTDSADPVSASAPFSYTLEVSNLGPSNVPGIVTVIDTLPASVSLASAAGLGWTCSSSALSISCTRTGAAVGVLPSITVNVSAPSEAGSLMNTATVSSDIVDPDPANNTDTETTQVTGTAGLSISKIDSIDPVLAGGLFNYLLTVTNAGPSTVANAVVSDALPSGVQFQSASGSGWVCSETAGTVQCTRPSLAVGSSVITISVRAPTEGGTLVNTATVSSDTPDPIPGDNSDGEDTEVTPSINLDVVKSGPGGVVRVGQLFDYRFSLSNAGPSTATGISLQDVLPAAVAYDSASGTGWSCSATGQTVSCLLASAVAPAATAPLLTLRVRALSPGTITNTCIASAQAPDADGQPSCEIQTTIDPPDVDLEFAKTDVTDPVAVGGTIDYVISGSNLGPDTAPSVTVIDTLPAGTTWISATGSGWSCGHASGVVTCTRGTTPVGAIPVISIQVAAPAIPGSIDNTCVVEAAGTSDPSPGNSNCVETTGVDPRADLALVKTDSADPVNASAAYNYTLAVSNLGPTAVPGTVTVVDNLPASVAFVSAVGSGWSCSSAVPTVTCTRTGAALGVLPSITINVTAPSEAGSVSNTATVSSDVVDPDPANNTDSESTQVTGTAGLSIAKTDSIDPVLAGGLFDYRLTVTNAGPSTVVNPVVSDVLPAGVTFQSASGSGWTCAHNAGTVECTRASLAVGTSLITVSVRAPTEGVTVLNTATVSSDTPDPTSGDNTDDETTTVTPVIDLDVTKTGPATAVRVGQLFDYRFNLSNAGPSTASGVGLQDVLPAAVAYDSFTGTGWSCSATGHAVSCLLASTVAPAATAPELTIRVRAVTPGTITNTCIASAQALDVNGQPSCRVDTTIEPPSVDLSVIKTTSTPVVPIGGVLRYALTVTNRGPDAAPANSVRLVDTLPAGVTFQSAGGSGWSCSATGLEVTCLFGPGLPVNGVAVVEIVALSPSSPGTIQNTCIAETVGAIDPTPDDCRVTNVVEDRADLALIKSDSVDPVAAGGAFSYTLTVRNNGPSVVTGPVIVTDTLPSALGTVQASGAGWSCSQVATALTCTRTGLPLGEAPVLTIAVNAPAEAGSLLNVATVAGPDSVPDPNPTNNRDEETTQVTALSGLSILKTDSADPVRAGTTFSYALRVNNAGPSVVVNARVTDPLPPGLTFVSANSEGWTCVQANATVQCDRATLAVGISTIQIQVRAPNEGGVVTNTATVTSETPDQDLGDNVDAEDTTITPVTDLDVVKSGPTTPVMVGSTFEYQLLLRNAGPSTATGVRLIDTLPNAVAFVSAAGTGWSCGASGLTVQCDQASSVAAGASAPVLSIRVRALSPRQVLNTCVAEALGFDPDGQPSCRVETTIAPSNDNLVIEVSDEVDPVEPGQAFAYFVQARNTGDRPLTQVRIEGAAEGVIVRSLLAMSDGLQCQEAHCTMATLAPGEVVRYRVDVNAPTTPMSLAFEAVGFAAEEETTLVDNVDREPTEMLGPVIVATPIPAVTRLGLLVLFGLMVTIALSFAPRR